jgi:GNAT superfamily N-acetyltransferase
MNRTWTTTWLGRADLCKIEEFRQLFSGGKNYSDVTMSEFYEWKYFRGSEGPAYVRVAMDKGKLVGTLAATLKRIKIGGRTLLAAEMGDGFTHPEYQYQGIFTVLGRELIAELEEKGVHFAYGRPNANSCPGLVRRMGFDNIFRLRTMRRFVNIDSVLRRKTGGGLLYSLTKPATSILSNTMLRVDEPPALPGVTISEASSFDESVGRLFDEVSGDDTAMVVRDSRYLNWRYADKPVDYKIYTAGDGDTLVGYVIVRTIKFEAGHKYGYLVDIMGKSTPVMRLLLGRAMQYFTGEGVDLVSTWVMKDLRLTDSTYYQALKRARFGFARDEYYFLTRTDLPEVKRLIYGTDAACWRFRLGETDGI